MNQTIIIKYQKIYLYNIYNIKYYILYYIYIYKSLLSAPLLILPACPHITPPIFPFSSATSSNALF